MDKCFCPKASNYYVFSLILFQYIQYELYTCVGVFFSCNDMAKNTYCLVSCNRHTCNISKVSMGTPGEPADGTSDQSCIISNISIV